jgi:hypothetical protein
LWTLASTSNFAGIQTRRGIAGKKSRRAEKGVLTMPGRQVTGA